MCDFVVLHGNFHALTLNCTRKYNRCNAPEGFSVNIFFRLTTDAGDTSQNVLERTVKKMSVIEIFALKLVGIP